MTPLMQMINQGARIGVEKAMQELHEKDVDEFHRRYNIKNSERCRLCIMNISAVDILQAPATQPPSQQPQPQP